MIEYKNIPIEFFGKNKFARVGISHITEHIADTLIDKVKGKDFININTSSQPNSNPHFGTVTTMMCVFAIAKELKDYFKIPVKITFDQLENAPDRSNNGLKKEIVDGKEIEYQISLKDSYIKNKSLVDINMETFYQLFDFLSDKTGVDYVVRSYNDFQSLSSFRKPLINMLQDTSKYKCMVNPTDDNLKVRFPCPKCKWVDKHSVNTKIVAVNDSEIKFSAYCPEHGAFYSTLKLDGEGFFDTNTPLRAIAKGVSLIEESKKENSLSVMVDGRDWSGRWCNMVFNEGLTSLGYLFNEFPVRFFTPTITDRSGAKLSKSLYVGDDVYKYLPEGFVNYKIFLDVYGLDGLNLLWNHISSWAKDPAYLDRDSYSIDYFSLLLDGKL